MEENAKVRGLGNELVRYFLNTEEKLLTGEAKDLIDRYATKLLTSGYRREQVVRIVVSGIRCYEARVKRCKREGRKLYRTAAQSSSTRMRKKLLGKTEWYRKRSSKPGAEATSPFQKPGEKPRPREARGKELPKGELAKLLREAMADMEGALGFRFKIVEKTGTPLKLLFSPTNLWEGVSCGRGTCVTCTQGGEKLPPCTKRSLVYENICVRCNPTANIPYISNSKIV